MRSCANANSFQQVEKDSNAVAIIPEAPIRVTIKKKVFNLPHPSTLAARSTSMGKLEKMPIKNHTFIGIRAAMYVIIKPKWVPTRLYVLNIM